ncbi:hypothetical protein M8J71_22890 [Pseudarthrobacter sp. R1]|uniref:hypothetical protein n=1 Tax=Pseudarthrobacter sp. R1 TaxID=2944934 RepID=UPI00210DA06C|nr:hypothetical protein [Pseudarthrobacter sp. R1]MCQ6273295.1 hypothetical protein [Pseudarthrobacter sp. R1]
MLGIEVLVIAGLSAALILIPDDPESAANGAAYAGLATSAAFFAGHLAVRVSKLAQPFEYTKWKSLMVLLPIFLPILLNVLVVSDSLEWFFKLFAADWKQLTETYSVILAVAGLGCVAKPFEG